MLHIKILGPGCANCEKLASAAKKAVVNFGVPAKIEKITARDEIMSYRVLATPGLVINERLVSAGRIPSEAEVMTWIADALETV